VRGHRRARPPAPPARPRALPRPRSRRRPDRRDRAPPAARAPATAAGAARGTPTGRRHQPPAVRNIPESSGTRGSGRLRRAHGRTRSTLPGCRA